MVQRPTWLGRVLIHGHGWPMSLVSSELCTILSSQDEIVTDIEARIATWTFLPVENGEPIQVLRYEQGQKYDPHLDFFGDKYNLQFGGHRVATMLMYLSNVEKGGETVFPMAESSLSQPKDDSWSKCAKMGYAVKPVKGDALLFFNICLNATVDSKTLHGSCPVIDGEKWSATKWIHASNFDIPYKKLRRILVTKLPSQSGEG
ncbi:hypothetical protein TanjilG_11931 [Lupinus angustifolius]|uniref:Fe2OG dioxygenase domain-containing protein n=1 Tax=Lupinus angustifolius TaxID=3871 RepID=A0A1J7HXY0_LUPAN|nr:hypothetical protein TanjilG_11931 [Lupinus angustifolius]